MVPEEERPKPPPLPPSGSRNPDHPWHGALEALGLQPDPKGLAGLNFKGEVDGFPVQLHCSRRTRTKYRSGDGPRTRHYVGHRLEIVVETKVKTRVTIFGPMSLLGRWVAKSNKWFGSLPVETPGLFPRNYHSWATEVEWVKRFFAGEKVSSEISRLLPEENIPSNIGLKWWPGHLTFSQRIDINRITPDALTRWVRAVVNLAALAEADPPDNEVELNRWEKFSTKNPLGAGCLLLGCLFGVIMFASLIVVGLLLVASYFFSVRG